MRASPRVSRMEIRSRAAGAETGGLLRCEAGRITLHSETPAKPGTRIQIDDLFFNLPARRKFLKSSSAELRRIIQIVNDYALIHPEVSFRVQEEGRKILEYSAAASIATSASSAAGGSRRRFSIPLRRRGPSRPVSGGIRFPTRGRVVVMLFVNGRRVQDAAVRAALTAAEARGIRRSGAVMIDLPPHDVDVNIHPTRGRDTLPQKSGNF